tara:strand:- start:14145 stop:20381 length:6237 start_codon:yes stop_codon:yes gene_type:complete
MASSKINIDLVLNAKGFRPLGRINGQLGEFEKSLDASNARVLAFGASAGAILAVRKALTATVKAAIEVEKSLQDINVILQATSSNLKKFGSDLFQIASQTGQSFQVAAEAAAELARQGLGTAETLKRTKDALILARLSGMGAAEAVNSLTAAINTFNKAGLDSTTIINKLANVDAAFAVSSDDLAKALGRVGSSAQGAGVSLDQLLAIVTTVQQKTARGGAVIGNSFKTIFTRIQRPRVIQELENLGIAVRDVEGEVLPAIKVLSNLARQFDNLSSSQRSQISELVGGVFQVNILKAAMSDLSKETGIYSRALDISLGSSDQAIRRNEELNKTLSAQFQRTVNTFKEGAAELGQLTFAPSLERLFGVVEGFEKLGQTDGGKIGGAIAKSIFEGIGQFISGPGLLIIGFTLFKTFSQLGKFAADAFKTLTGLNKNFQTQLNLQKQIFNVLEENPDLLNKIKSGAISVEDAHKEIFSQISKNTDALEEQLRMSQRLAQGLSGSGVGFDAEFGAYAGSRRPKFGKAAGYAPNFADEVAGMMASGYSNSQIRNPKVRKQNIHDGMGGSFTSTVNGHEDIINTRNSMGKKATFVVPPKNTEAYKEYMSALSGGFVPNFAGVSLGPFVKNFKGTGDDLLKKIRTDIASGKMSANVLQAGRSDLGLSVEDLNKARQEGKALLDKSKIVSKKGDLVTGQGDLVNLDKRSGAKGGPLRIYDARKKFGLLGLYGTSSDRGYVESPVSKISKFKGITPGQGGAPGRIGFKNVQFRSVGQELSDDKQDAWFSKELRKKFALPMERLTNSWARKRLGLGEDAMSVKISGSGKPLFSVSAEGNIFETAVNALTAQGRGGKVSAPAFEAALGADQQQVWDFEESGRPDSLFKKYFDFDPDTLKADAKRTLNKKAASSMVNKIFNTESNSVWMTELTKAKKAQGGKAGGYIPNFNAIYESVRREKEAGVPAGRIRIGQSDKLKGADNPAGFGIYNTRDEPMGLNQGINNSIAAGIDPKKQGRSGGFIPNFFVANPAGDKSNVPKEFPIVLYDKTKTALVNTFTRAFKTGQKAIEGGMGADGAKRLNKEPVMGRVEKAVPEPPIIDVDPVKKEDKKTSKSLKANTAAINRNENATMNSIGQLMLVQQVATGLENALRENNSKTADVVKALGGLATTIVGLKFASSQFTDGFASKAADLRKTGTVVPPVIGSKQATLAAANPMYSDALVVGQDKVNRARQRSEELKKGGKRFARTRGAAGVGMARAGAGVGRLAASGGLMGAGIALAGLKAVGDLGSTTFSDTFQEAEAAGKALKRVKEETEKNIGQLNKFGTAAEQASQVFNNVNASMAELQQATKAMDKAMLELPAEMRAKLGGIIDPERVNSMIESMVEKEQNRAAEAQKRSDSANLLESTRDKGFFDALSGDVLNLFTTGNLSGKGDEELKQDKARIADQSEAMITSLISKNPNALENVPVEEIAKTMASTRDVETRVKAAKELGLSGTDLATFEKFIIHGGAAGNQAANSLIEAAIAAKEDAEANKKLKPIREGILRANRAQLKAVDDLKKQLESEQRVRQAVMKITMEGAKAFMTEVGKINLDEMAKLGDLQAKTADKFGNIVSQSQTAFGKALEGGGLDGTDLAGRITSVLNTASRKGVGSVKGVESLTASLDEQIAALENNGNVDDNQKQQLKELNALKVELENLSGNSERLKDELDDQTHEIKEQTRAQKMVARQQQRLKSFGGTQALLDPSKLNTQLTQIRAGGQAMAMSAASGSLTGFNRGSINQLAAVQELMGGSLPEHARARGLKQAEQVKFSDISKMNQALGLNMSQGEIRKAAQEQAAALFKGDNPTDRNTSAIETLTETLKTNKDIISRSREDTVAVNRAMNTTRVDKANRERQFRSANQDIRKASQFRQDDLLNSYYKINNATSGGSVDLASAALRTTNPFGALMTLGNMTGVTDPNGTFGQFGLDPASMLESEHSFLGMNVGGAVSADQRIEKYGKSTMTDAAKEVTQEIQERGEEAAKNININSTFNFDKTGNLKTSSGDSPTTAQIDGGIESLHRLKSEMERHDEMLKRMDPTTYGQVAPVQTATV